MAEEPQAFAGTEAMGRKGQLIALLSGSFAAEEPLHQHDMAANAPRDGAVRPLWSGVCQFSPSAPCEARLRVQYIQLEVATHPTTSQPLAPSEFRVRTTSA